MVDLGTLPDWLMVGVTLAGFGGTLWLINHEIDRRRDEETERMQDQAMTVGASAEWRKGGGPRITITNGSRGPVFSCMVRVHSVESGGEELTAKFNFDLVHPGTHQIPVPAANIATVTNTIIEFTDAGGHRWSRSSQGIFRDLGRPHG